MAITARDTTTPDSATLSITVEGAETVDEAREAAYALLAKSRYTKDSTIYGHSNGAHGAIIFHAEY